MEIVFLGLKLLLKQFLKYKPVNLKEIEIEIIYIIKIKKSLKRGTE